MQGRAVAELRGVIGAILGAGLGYLAFAWLASWGFYGVIVPGAALGLFGGIAAGRVSTARGVAFAVAAVPVGLLAEWLKFPFAADGSLGYFVAHLGSLRPPTWLLIGAGAILAFWMGRDPVSTVLASRSGGRPS